MADPLTDDVAAVARLDVVPRILDVVCRTTGLGFSAVARVTSTRWVACAVKDDIAFGLRPGEELDLRTTICDEIRGNGRLVVIDDVDADPTYCGHHTPRRYGFKSYISVPIVLPDGEFFGTLCAIDPRPARVNHPVTVETFRLFADLIARHLDADRRLDASERARAAEKRDSQIRIAAGEHSLRAEQQASRMREQFIAVLGHDLRNPLTAISSGAETLALLAANPKAEKVLGMVQRSVARMTGMIDDLLDFARGRLGGGMAVDSRRDPGIVDVLAQVVSELESTRPGRQVACDFRIDRPVECDGRRVGQLFSNLLANALAHGDPAFPVAVTARTNPGQFELAVTNRGATIPPGVLENLFEPFAGGDSVGREGLGLGLYIAAEIARAHGGVLDARSGDGETCFSFRMPLADATG